MGTPHITRELMHAALDDLYRQVEEKHDPSLIQSVQLKQFTNSTVGKNVHATCTIKLRFIATKHDKSPADIEDKF